MLKLKYLFENFELAKTCLEHWKYDAATLDRMLNYYRISANAVYPYRCDGRLCFLRLAPVTEKEERNLRGEVEFLLWLQTQGYPAMRPIAAKDSSYVLTLKTQWGDWYASSFEGVPGEPIEDSDFEDNVMFAYGKALGRLHTLSAAFTSTVRKMAHDDALDWVETVLETCDGSDAAHRELAAVRTLCAALPQAAGQYGLVHYDFECDNVFYDDETGICHAIDFDDGMYHWYVLDVEQALDSIKEECPSECFDAAAQAFLAGYRTEKPFGEAEQALRPLMRRFINLYSYARLKRSIAEPLAEEPDWMTEVKGKLTRKVAELEASFKA